MAIHIAGQLPEESIPAPDRGAPHFEVSWRATWYALGLCIALIIVIAVLLMPTALPN